MERKVVRTLTAGTLTDDSLITQGQTPTVVAISFAKQQMSVGLAQLDLAQGKFASLSLTATVMPSYKVSLLIPSPALIPVKC
ncbi:MAG: hypothetical protein U1E91_02255 [Moraxella sp.]